MTCNNKEKELTFNGMINILQELDCKETGTKVSLNLWSSGEGCLENENGSILVEWDNLMEMYNSLLDVLSSDSNAKTILSNKYN